MERWCRVLILGSLVAMLSGCGEGMAIGWPESPSVIDPEAGLPPGSIEITNQSYGNSMMSGRIIHAGTFGADIGGHTLRSYGRTAIIPTVTITLEGSAGPSEVRNLVLEYDGSPTCAPAATIIGTHATFDLNDCPVVLRATEQASFRYKANIVGGVSRYFQFSLNDANALVAHDLAGRSVPITLDTGTWPAKFTYVAIDTGSIAVKLSESFTKRVITAGAPQTQTLAIFAFSAYGEAARTSFLSVDLYFNDGFLPGDLYDLTVFNGPDPIALPLVNLPTTNPRATYSTNIIHPPGVINYEIVTAKVRDGTVGTVKACINHSTQGFTSLADLPTTTVCGNLMSATP